MSQLRTPTPGRSEVVRLPNREEIRVELTSDRDYAIRLDVVDDGLRWRYGVLGNGNGQLIDAFDDGTRVDDPTDPDWLRDVLLELGLDRGGAV
jgi:hypothetical protein